MALPSPQVVQSTPVYQGQPFVGNASSPHPFQAQGHYAQQPYPPYRPVNNHFPSQQPAHHKQQSNFNHGADLSPRTPTLTQRILRAFRMPRGRASTVASSRPESRDGDSDEEHQAPSVRRAKQDMAGAGAQPASRNEDRRRDRQRQGRSAAPARTEPSPELKDAAPASQTKSRTPSPDSDQATVHSDDYVLNRTNKSPSRRGEQVTIPQQIGAGGDREHQTPGAANSTLALRQSPERDHGAPGTRR